jgi:hypothetical protein
MFAKKGECRHCADRRVCICQVGYKVSILRSCGRPPVCNNIVHFKAPPYGPNCQAPPRGARSEFRIVRRSACLWKSWFSRKDSRIFFCCSLLCTQTSEKTSPALPGALCRYDTYLPYILQYLPYISTFFKLCRELCTLSSFALPEQQSAPPPVNTTAAEFVLE